MSGADIVNNDQRELENRLKDQKAHRIFKHWTFWGALLIIIGLFSVAYYWLFFDKTPNAYTHLVPFGVSLSAGVVLFVAVIKSVFPSYQKSGEGEVKSMCDMVKTICETKIPSP